MSDLIDRQAALDCFHDWIDRHGDVHTPDEMAEYRAIEELPSVEPEKRTEERTETHGVCLDAISRQAAIDARCNRFWLQQGDCLELMKNIPDGSVDLVLTDIPYGEVNRDSNGLRKLDKEKADILTFDLRKFLDELYRVCKGTIIVFCGQGQFSSIQVYFDEKQKKNKGTVRQIVWRKTNPSPMNGQHIYLSGIENAVWFKKRGGTFNAHCKNTVFDYPCGRSKLHPTEKNHELLKELILDNTNDGDIVFDPCMGSGSHGLVSVKNNRRFTGIELDEGYFNIAKKRIEEAVNDLRESEGEK